MNSLQLWDDFLTNMGLLRWLGNDNVFQSVTIEFWISVFIPSFNLFPSLVFFRSGFLSAQKSTFGKARLLQRCQKGQRKK